MLRLDLDNIYHSAAYVGIIGLILASLAVCTFKRVIPARLPPLRAVKIDKIPLHASVAVRGDEETVRGRVSAFFAERGWQVRTREIGGDEWVFADKHNWARRGVLVAHIGFVIIAAGTSIYWAKGFSGQAAVISGQSVTIPETGAHITLDKFGYRIDPVQTKSGTVFQPIDYVSDLTYSGRDGVAHKAILRVNHPLNIDGTEDYQASYGYGDQFHADPKRPTCRRTSPRDAAQRRRRVYDAAPRAGRFSIRSASERSIGAPGRPAARPAARTIRRW